MKLKAMNDDSVDINGTSGKSARIVCTRAELNRIFSEGYEYDDEDKVKYQWTLRFEGDNGETIITTIYDYKNYTDIGEDELYAWNIGGNSDLSITALALNMLKRGGNYVIV
jgi:hypothetical protein